MQPSAILRLVYATCGLVIASPASAASPQLQLPLVCTPSTDCWVPNYVDDDPSPMAKDYTGGVRTYDGHKGTDFAIPDKRIMAAGVVVTASASGKVLGVRDGMQDIEVDKIGHQAVQNRECGNGVVIDHGDGWHTQYCHMRQGSIGVKPGDVVATGAPLGLVGMSGDAAFPHVHLQLSHDDAIVDPFVEKLWAPPAAALLAYHASDVYLLGVSAAAPNQDGARDGDYDDAKLTQPLDSFFLWADMFGVRPGDQLAMRIGGKFDKTAPIPVQTPKARQFVALRVSSGVWLKGEYRLAIDLLRGGRVVARNERAFVIE